MSKAILILDMPKNCNECKLKYVHTRKDSWYCCSTDIEVEYECNMEMIDNNCPLKPMLTKKVPVFDPNDCDIEKEKQIIHEIDGYNRAIDELLGETKQ